MIRWIVAVLLLIILTTPASAHGHLRAFLRGNGPVRNFFRLVVPRVAATEEVPAEETYFIPVEQPQPLPPPPPPPQPTVPPLVDL